MKALNLYIHIPFCRQKCPYCHFFSIGENKKKYNYEHYIKEMHKEMVDKYRHLNLKNYQLNSIYFGGGTPSLLAAEHLEYLLTLINTLWQFPDELEITLESNPNYILAEYLTQIKAIGINRLSLGIQSVNPKFNNYIGRENNKDHLKKIIQTAKSLNLKINLDFIYAWPKQNLKDLNDDLNFAMNSSPDHLSFYELEIKNNTAINDLKENTPKIFPSENKIIKMRQKIENTLAAAGWEHYEISNWTKNKNYSQHNLNFWLNEEYLGLGPSADSYINNQIIHNHAELHQYYNFQEQYEISPLTNEENALQYLIRGLRSNRGISLNTFDKNLAQEINNFIETLDKNLFLSKSKEKIILSESGWLHYDYLLNEFSNIIYDYFRSSKNK